MTLDAGHRLFIDRARLAEARLGPDPDAPAARPLGDGQARLAVDRFAITANNITYAAFGEMMKYWQFFPSGEASTGCLPVWGFATVAESTVPGLDVGRRVWGYYPAGTHLVVTPAKVSPGGFLDGAAHRQELAVVYNQYVFCDADPAWTPAGEGLQAVFQPLFSTSFLIDDFLEENRFFGAGQVLMSSASSKTAIGTAWCLAQRRGTPGAPRIVGLTSAGNRAYTEGLGLYDKVLTYDQLETLPATPTVYVDFAGDAPLRQRIHAHFGDALTYSNSIGGTHWKDIGPARDLPGPKPTLFFAPAQAKQRAEAWGPKELQRRLGEARAAFLGAVASGRWLDIEEGHGAQAALEAYGRSLAGTVDARLGLVVRMPSAGG